MEEHEKILKDLSILRILYDVVSPLMRATFPLGPYRVFLGKLASMPLLLNVPDSDVLPDSDTLEQYKHIWCKEMTWKDTGGGGIDVAF